MKTLDIDRNETRRDRAGSDKKRYAQFQLVEYGTLRTLTLGGPHSCPDGVNPEEGNMGVAGNCLMDR